MKEENKILLKTFISSGLIFASTMAIYGYFADDEFLVWRFIAQFLLFGITIGFIARKNHRKKLKEEANKHKNHHCTNSN
ncbi:MAG TPA: hypothetical protein VJ973_02485 [Christiangramia sp.]|nr:hypothetical protein [Christiangramia sp.]